MKNVLALALISTAALAHAQVLDENFGDWGNTQGTATNAGNIGAGLTWLGLGLHYKDQDWVTFTYTGPAAAMTFDTDFETGSGKDTILAVSVNGGLFTTNDDDLNSALDSAQGLGGVITSAGQFVNVQGSILDSALSVNLATGDVVMIQIRPFSLNNTEGTYDLWVNTPGVVPEPATMTVLGLGALAVAARRRRK